MGGEKARLAPRRATGGPKGRGLGVVPRRLWCRIVGPLAPAFWGKIVPGIVNRLPELMLPPPQPIPPGAIYDYRGPRPPYGPPPAARDMRPPLPRHAPVAQAAPIQVEPDPTPEDAPAPLPAVIPAAAPAVPSPFEEFCATNPSAPPCRSRVRGQR